MGRSGGKEGAHKDHASTGETGLIGKLTNMQGNQLSLKRI